MDTKFGEKAAINKKKRQIESIEPKKTKKKKEKSSTK